MAPPPGVGELGIDGQNDVQLSRRREPTLAGGVTTLAKSLYGLVLLAHFVSSVM